MGFFHMANQNDTRDDKNTSFLAPYQTADEYTHEILERLELIGNWVSGRYDELDGDERIFALRLASAERQLAKVFLNADFSLTSHTVLRTIDEVTASLRSKWGEIVVDFEQLFGYLDRLLELIPLIQLKDDGDEIQLKLSHLDNLEANLRGEFHDIKKEAESALKRANDNVDAIEKSKNDLDELVNLAAKRTLENEYDKRALSEKNAANIWTVFTAMAALLALALIIFSFFYQLSVARGDESTQFTRWDLQLLGTKILLAVTLGVIAKWASKRAQRHLSEEAKYHRLTVNMATIDSFIAGMDNNRREEIKTAVAVKIFTDISGNETSIDYETPSTADLIKQLLSGKDSP